MSSIRTANLTGSISRNAGGLHESVRRLMQSLGEQDVGVRIFGVADEFTKADVGVWDPVPVSVFKPYWPPSFGYSPGFYRELAAYKPDLMHTHGIWMYPSVVTNRYSSQTHVPFMISPHGMLDRWAIQNSRWKKAIAYALYEGAHLREAGCIRALCQSEANSIRELGLVNPICVVPNGIDLPETAIAKAPPWTGHVEPGRKVALFLSRIHPKKGLVNLLHAWQQARGEKGGGDWVLAIAGWDQGGHEQELKELAGKLGLAFTDIRGGTAGNGAPQKRAEVIFLGPQFGDGKQASYAACDAFILPSFSEGLPMVVLEAWAHSKPVVMTPECNIPEGFAAGAAIEIPTDAKGIATGLTRLFGMSASELKTTGADGKQLVLDKFVWSRIATDIKAVYQWMLGGGTPPGVVRFD